MSKTKNNQTPEPKLEDVVVLPEDNSNTAPKNMHEEHPIGELYRLKIENWASKSENVTLKIKLAERELQELYNTQNTLQTDQKQLLTKLAEDEFDMTYTDFVNKYIVDIDTWTVKTRPPRQ